MATSLSIANLRDLSKEELAAQLARARAFIKSGREHGKRATRLGFIGLATAGGGVAAGVLAMKMPKLPGPLSALDSDLAIGGALQLAAFLDLGDQYNDQLNAFGAGLVAAGLARETQALLLKRQQAA